MSDSNLTTMIERLRSVEMFAALNDDDLKMLGGISRFVAYTSGSVLFYEGSQSKKLFVLIEGIVKAYKTDMRENEIVLHHFCPVSLVAEMANLRHIPYPATAEFQTEGVVLEIDYPLFERDFLRNPDIAFAFITSLSHKIKYLDNIITNRLSLDATSRVAKFLYEHGTASGSTKRAMIATILGLTPETLSRSLKKLKMLGLISDEGKYFSILNKEGLRELFS
ncbi:MAG: Crp/Fnr family transcriptional regulator [Campylobacterales bacterium]|nr:Crp/Fnr family transcriptional regulator [Campylobacterales bacterium]